MTHDPDLTLAFINRRPESASRVLATLSTEEAGAFLSEIPTRYAVKVSQPLHAVVAAPIVASMDAASAAALIRDMEFSSAASILRQIPQAKRSDLTKDLRKRRKRDFESSLAFPANTVGARMSTSISVLAGTETVKAAIEVLLANKESSNDLVFVTGEKKRLVGVVKLINLMQHGGAIMISEIMDTSCQFLTPITPVAETVSLRSWDKFGQLPVVNRHGEPIGVVHRAVLRSSDSEVNAPYIRSDESMLMDLFQLMGTAVAGLTQILVPAMDPSDRNGSSNGQ